MNTIRLKLESAPLKIVVPDCITAIGSVFDHNATKLIFERKAENQTDSLKIHFAGGGHPFAPIDLGKENEFVLPDLFTQNTVLNMQVSYERGGEVIAHSNIVPFYFRDSMKQEEQALSPSLKAMSGLLEQAITDVYAEDNMLRFQNSAGKTVVSAKISGNDLAIQEMVNELQTQAQIADAVYLGTDLTQRHASEIAAAPFNGNPWVWIQARIKAADWRGIHVGDWIPFITLPGEYSMADKSVVTKATGYSLNAVVMGIDTYAAWGTYAPRHHIDFMSDALWPDPHPYNQVKYNNGTADNPGPFNPWAASDCKAWANSEAAKVPGSAAADLDLLSVDYRSTGVYDKLPAAMKAVITAKMLSVEARYQAGRLLTTSTGLTPANLGKLWLPTEAEMSGYTGFGTMKACSGSVQYPLFASSRRNVSKSNQNYWIQSVMEGDATQALHVNSNGRVTPLATSDTATRIPLCFRIA